ncbi:putative DNA-binding domain-containing protein [Methylacidimicrobium sp. AP8]|uniref:HvfC/BufC family peptide modification chaperone n=1 Tax=Methylacidimicrobium sp. AP8 TaxID=2730359 RepID=UPI0018C15D74|nr:putative DNA-binding domain-containing protein [Methylacidimicrobium sp. AP8]CAB4243699.1 putative DNA-binding domain-containing protein [Methylacidimicrobium sp. AP8]
MPSADSLEELRELQRLLFSCITRPSGPDEGSVGFAAQLVRSSGKLAPVDRIEIYRRQYWIRLLSALSEDYPGLAGLLGAERFRRTAQAYLLRYPPTSPMLPELGSRLPRFLREEPGWAAPFPPRLVLDLARFEWAKIAAFHAPEAPLPQKEELSSPEIRLFLQPHLNLLHLRYPVDRPEPGETFRSTPLRPEARRIVVHRQGSTVYHKLLPREAFSLLRSFAKGISLFQACRRTAARFPDLAPERYRDWFREWAALGWLTTSPSLARAGRPQASKTA